MAKNSTKKVNIDEIFTQKLKKSIKPSYYDAIVKDVLHSINSDESKIG